MAAASWLTAYWRLLVPLRLQARYAIQGLLLGLCAAYSLNVAAAPASLTVSEREYINQHPVLSLCVNPDWLPFAAVDDNQQYIGIFSDLMSLVAEKVGFDIKIHETNSWDESIAASQNDECFAISGLNQTPEREQWLIFTDPLLVDPNVLITREEHPFIPNINKLKNQTIALQQGTATAELMARDFPYLNITYTQTEAESMQLVADGKVELTVGSLAVAAHTIAKNGWYNLKVSGQLPGYENRSRIGVSKSESALRAALNSGIAAITAEERQRIMDRHLSLRVQSEAIADYTLVYALAALLMAVIITSLFWMRRLNALNQQLSLMSQTDALTQLTNRHGLNLTLAKDLERAKRYQHPLSVVMMDIDHFKRVNDQYGHLTGDNVLVTCAQLLKNNLRKSDIICRWGGEEFLVICFDTNQAQASLMAELLLTKIRQHDFPEVGRVTLSAGVTQATSTDTPETLTKRVDTLLYQAKNNGRDQVCTGGDLDDHFASTLSHASTLLPTLSPTAKPTSTSKPHP